MTRLIYHLGYPKTGTTYLQSNIFNQLSSTHALLMPEFENIGVTIQKLKHQIERGTLPANIKSLVGGRPLLVSMEGFILDHMRQFMGKGEELPSFHKTLEGLVKLQNDVCEENVSIVLYLRAQQDLLHSVYAESKTYYFDMIPELNTITGYVDAVISPALSSSDPGWYYNYKNTISEIRGVFPTADLHIRFYEALCENPVNEIKFWSDLVGVNLNHVEKRDNRRTQVGGSKLADPRSLHVAIAMLKRKYAPNIKVPNQLKFIIRDFLKEIGKGDALKIEITKELYSRIELHFSEINSYLVESGVKIPHKHISSYIKC